ncbi:MAG: amidase [Planctomycetales bacterium]|nr:amidase [Planctomycetales bacterium]MBN8628092.1 amidase [Planctomycetota bacterium]
MSPLLSIAAAAELLRKQELTPVGLLDQCLARIDLLDSEVRAWALVDREGARAAAEQATTELASGIDRGPLHGIPIGVKDIIDVRGLPTFAGAKVRPNIPAPSDAFVVAKLREAGAVIVGKTVTTEFASFDPSPARNPWNAKRTPGGSSAGSAVAPVCGMCFAALGTQTGGSIIRPASYCGAAGLKPTWGHLSLQGIIPLAYHLDHPGVLARSVGDLELTYRALVGFDATDACSVRGAQTPPSADIYQAEIDAVGVPRLGVVRDYFFDRSTDNVRKGVTEAMDRLRKAGATVSAVTLPKAFADVHRSHRLVMAVEAAAYHRETFLARRADYGPRISELLDEGLAATAVDYSRALEHQLQFRRAMEQMLAEQQIDALVMPAVSNTAPPLETTGDPTFQAPWSFAGLPVVSIPCELGDDDMPVALQFVGPSWSEGSLLAVAAWCEREIGFGEVPPMLQK